MASQACFVHALTNFILDFVNSIFEAFGNRVHPQWIHVEAVGFGGKYEKRHNGFVGFAIFELQTQKMSELAELASA